MDGSGVSVDERISSLPYGTLMSTSRPVGRSEDTPETEALISLEDRLMRLTRSQFTIRRLMLAVGIVAVIVGLIVEGEKRRARFHKFASKHYDEAARYFVMFAGGESAERESMRLWEERVGPTVKHHADLRDKYERAARQPWCPLEPDPPAPPKPATSYPWLPITPGSTEPN